MNSEHGEIDKKEGTTRSVLLGERTGPRYPRLDRYVSEESLFLAGIVILSLVLKESPSEPYCMCMVIYLSSILCATKNAVQAPLAHDGLGCFV